MKFSRQSPSPKEMLPSLLSALGGGRYARSLLKFEPRDVWIGLYWKATDIEYEYAKDFVRSTHRWRLDIFICPLPCLLIRFAIECGNPKWKRGDMSNFNRGRDETNRHIMSQRDINLPEDRSEMIARAIEADEPKGTP